MAGRKQSKSTPKVYRGSYYTYGNVAYDMQPEFQPYYEKEQRQQEQKEAARQAAAERRENRIHAFWVVLVMLVMFLGCIAFMGAHVIVANQEVQIRQQKSDLAALKSQNAILEAELAEQIDLEYIKQEAMGRLGMTENRSRTRLCISMFRNRAIPFNMRQMKLQRKIRRLLLLYGIFLQRIDVT